MESVSLGELIQYEIMNNPDNIRAYEDLFAHIRNLWEDGDEEAYSLNKWLMRASQKSLMFDPVRLSEVYKHTLLIDSHKSFDSYMLYLEWNRKPSERFYLPRRRILKDHVQGIQDLVDDKLDELFLSQPPRTGKALANDTPVLTRNGWKNHGDLVVGDEVIGMDGTFRKVTHVHPKCQLDVLVEFTNGEKIQCHERHEWLVHDRRLQRNIQVETRVLEERGWENEIVGRGHRYYYMLPQKEFIKGERRQLPLDPYTFGARLGDGTNQDPRITGDSRADKYIPDIYLTADVEQRLQLLAGLLDTDGCLSRKERRYHYSTTDKKLAGSFIQLVSTFGWRTVVIAEPPRESSFGIEGGLDCYKISFNPTRYIPCRIERKQLREFSKPRRIAIKSITRVEPKEGNCITIEGDGMYLAGHTMLPTHNTTLAMMLFSWIIGRDSEKSNLYCAFSDTITRAFYQGVLEILNDPTYLWREIFPKSKIVQTNAAEETINIDRKKRYPSLTCRSLYGTLNGAVDCNGFLVADDLIGSIEEAMNKDRLVNTWAKVDNNMLPRAKQGTKILWWGTRWSVSDPIGIRNETLDNDSAFKGRRYRVINIPALNENDESNFEYDFGVGFDTDFYHQRRASFERNNDMASWLAQYMGEPIEREGALFSPDDFRYYNGVLPPDEPDRVFMAVDPSWGGGDFTSAPVCYQYGDIIYVADVVYDNGDKRITQPLIVNAIIKHRVSAVQFEANKMTESYRDEVDKMLRARGYRCNVMSRPAPTNKAKEQRIFDKAPEIRESFIFLESGHRPKEYNLFIQNVYSFKMYGKNDHDDAPDSLSMACDMAFGRPKVATAFKRFI